MAVTPDKDTTIEAIATSLSAAINSRWGGAVAAMSAIDRIPTDPTRYPHLVVHRRGSTGQHLEYCQGVIRYIMPSPVELEKVPGRMRAMQLAIVDKLRKLSQGIGGDSALRWQINPDQSFVCRELILGFGNGLMPFIEIEFEFVDFDSL
jgi:hypothetical protein